MADWGQQTAANDLWRLGTRLFFGRPVGLEAWWSTNGLLIYDMKCCIIQYNSWWFWVPSGNHTKSYWKLPFIVSFPIKNGGFFHSYSYVNVYQRVKFIAIPQPHCNWWLVWRRIPLLPVLRTTTGGWWDVLHQQGRSICAGVQRQVRPGHCGR